MSSFKLGPGVRARLCNNVECVEDSSWNSMELYGPYSVGVLWDSTNDLLSWAEIRPYDVPQLLLFSTAEFGMGRTGLFGPGDYTN